MDRWRPAVQPELMAVAWNGSVFCAVAAGGNVCATSPDGLSWTERTMSMSASWNDITWNGTIFCAAPTHRPGSAPLPGWHHLTNVGNGLGGNLRAAAWNGEYFSYPTTDSARPIFRRTARAGQR